ncbi:MAG: DUF4347 domain-containing protein, partial [Gammaproteobacteria bacterium]|nr:DUF4347 domain-containing protein [Gammaproteobacteria bacterium]
MFDGAALVDAVDPQIAEPLVIEAPAPVPEVAEPQAKTNEIVFVDSAVNDYQTLLNGISSDAEVIILDADRDGLQQMTEALSGRSGIDAIHIISHGQAGVLKLGGSSIDQAALEGYSDELASIGSVLAADGDILLYGCDIAEGSVGNNFIEALADSTSADIAASDDLTGAASQGGDWVLEKRIGQIDSDAFSSINYDAVLADVVIGYNPGTSGNPTSVDGGVWGQSFTATKTGVMSNIKLLVQDTAASDIDFKFYSGESVSGGALLASQTVVSGDLQNLADTLTDWTTITLSSTVNITSGQQYTFTFEGSIKVAFFYETGGLSGAQLYSSENGGFLSGYDMHFQVTQGDGASNAAPTVTGTPSDPSLTEDTEGNIDLSALTFADADGDNLTVTLTASEGTFATPLDGSGVGSGVTETWVDATHITLEGSAADINTYLDTAANIKYTGAADDNGDNTATITVSAGDGNGGSLASDPVVNIDIAA